MMLGQLQMTCYLMSLPEPHSGYAADLHTGPIILRISGRHQLSTYTYYYSLWTADILFGGLGGDDPLTPAVEAAALVTSAAVADLCCLSCSL